MSASPETGRYAVRGKDAAGAPVCVVERVADGDDPDGEGVELGLAADPGAATAFLSADAAIAAMWKVGGIFEAHVCAQRADGTEEPLPSFEELRRQLARARDQALEGAAEALRWGATCAGQRGEHDKGAALEDAAERVERYAATGVFEN